MASSLNQSHTLPKAAGRLHVQRAKAVHAARLSVLLVEEHGAISELISAFLAQHMPHMQVLGTVQNLEEARALCKEILPDVIVFEPLLPNQVPLDIVGQLLHLCPKAKMLAFTRSNAPGLAAEIRAVGVRGIISRRRSLAEFVEALKLVAEGGTFFDGEYADQETLVSVPKLTLREKLVVKLVSEGMSTKQIAVQMAVSSKTVDKFRQKAMNKLDLHDAVRVTRYAIKNGLSSI